MNNTTFEFSPIWHLNTNDSKQNDFSFTNNSSETFSENINLIPGIPLTYNSLGNEFPLISFMPSIHSLDKELEEDKKRFFFDKSVDNLLKINEEKNSSDNIVNQSFRKKRGRAKKKYLNKNDNVHDKNSSDNIFRKIQVHYMSFIVLFLNEILQNLNIDKRFYKIDYEFKNNVNKKFVKELKRKTIGDIISTKISTKYRKLNVKINQVICDEIKENEVMKKILSQNYLNFFKKIYYQSNKYINLKEYGLNKDIILSENVKMYKDLLKSIETLDIEYKKKIDQCINNNFLKNNLFFLEK